MNRQGGKYSVPDRWMNCPPTAKEVVCNFLAFKTPLSEEYNDKVPPERRFYPQMVFTVAKEKKASLGLWIDLTNTSRFYNKEVVEAKRDGSDKCIYFKLQCRGHGETPSKEQTNEFVMICDRFIQKNPQKLIGIHCTHGFNRTGFLIVSYLIKSADNSVEDALEIFARARPPGIYKKDYIDELFKRYGDIEDAPAAPERPAWCFDEEPYNDDDDDDFKIPPEPISNESSSSKSEGRKVNSKRVPFMEGIPGVTELTDYEEAAKIKKRAKKMCKFHLTGFPGCQPVSMTMENLSLLEKKPYRVSWKADGTRYMMYIDGEDKVYFLDRGESVFKVENLKFFYKRNFSKHLEGTLLDGEMVIDKVDGKNIPRYLAYDIISFMGDDVGKESFYPTRISVLDYEVVRPRHAAMQSGRIDKASEPFSVRLKQFWDISVAGSLLGEKFASTLSHEPDGLIFQPSKEPYSPGRCDEVLKWKPADMNSIDFKLKIEEDKGGLGKIPQKQCCLYVGQLSRPFAKMKYKQGLKAYDGKIVECKVENNQWVFMRERTDKTFPNSYETALAVWNSIKTPVTPEILLHFIKTKKFRDDCEDMPPPSSMPAAKRFKK